MLPPTRDQLQALYTAINEALAQEPPIPNGCKADPFSPDAADLVTDACRVLKGKIDNEVDAIWYSEKMTEAVIWNDYMKISIAGNNPAKVEVTANAIKDFLNNKTVEIVGPRFTVAEDMYAGQQVNVGIDGIIRKAMPSV